MRWVCRGGLAAVVGAHVCEVKTTAHTNKLPQGDFPLELECAL